MSTQGTDSPSPLGPPSAAVQALLQRVANLCVLGQLPEDAAVQMLRESYARAHAKGGAGTQQEMEQNVDAFVAGQVLSEWHQNTSFLRGDGNPASLSLSAGGFAELCKTASAATNPERLLELLVQAGAVTVSGDLVTALRRELILDYAHPAAVTRAIRLSADFSATLHHNLSRNVREPGLFERAVVSTKLAQRQIPSLLAYLSVHGQSFLEDLDSWMSAREAANAGPAIGVGVYLFVGDEST